MNAIDVSLLRGEWGDRDTAGCHRCHDCGAVAPVEEGGDESSTGRHNLGCGWDDALGQRGFFTQTERRNARERIKAANADTVPPPSGTRP